MNISNPPDEQRLNGFQILVFLLSVIVLCSMFADSVFVLPKESSRVLDLLDLIVCAVFFIDFCIRYHRATDKLDFMKLGWIDLLASVPNIDILRWGRLVRVLRIIRILRGVRSFQKVLELVFRRKVKSGMGAVLTASFLMIMFSSITILICEDGKDGNIKTAEDAVWWSVTTITTVGYGDKYPTTTEGRLVAAILMISGVGLFGTISGLIATYFLGPQQNESVTIQDLSSQLNVLQQKIDALGEKP